MSQRGWMVASALVCAGMPTLAIGNGRVDTRDEQPTRLTPRSSLLGRSVHPPLSFEANLGQADQEVRFLARAQGYRAFLLDAGVVFSLPRGGEKLVAGAFDEVRMQFEGTSASATARGELPLAGRSHYLSGNDPALWVRDVPHFGQVGISNFLSGVSLRWKPAKGRLLEYDLTLAPGADPGVVTMRFDGAQSPVVDATGDLLLRTPGGVLRHGRPVAWQERDGRRQPVAAEFILLGESRVGFRFGHYDGERPLIVDPVVQYASYHGGSSDEIAVGIATDSSRAVYLTGRTTSTDFPTKSAYRSTYVGGNYDAFITKVAADGASLVYSTYLGGTGDDYGKAIAVDASGAAYVTGQTSSTNFPVANAFQGTKPAGSLSAFVTKLSPTGTTLSYSTYLGGNGTVIGEAIAVDSSGYAHVGGFTGASDFPVVSGLQEVSGGGNDGFVTKFAPSGSTLSWSTYVGGSATDEVSGVALASNGTVFITGTTQSANLPTLNPYQASLNGTRDAYVMKISASGSSRLFSTYLGGSGSDYAYGIAVDSSSSAWVVGYTGSSDFPLQSPSRSQFSGPTEGYVAKFSPQGNSLDASTFLGGNGDEQVNAIAIVPGGAACVVGRTTSTDFILSDPLQGSRQGVADAFMASLSSTGTTLLWSTYYGGSGDDYAFGVAADSAHSYVVAGGTDSTNFPTVTPFQGTKGNGADTFVLRLKPTLLPPSDCKAVLSGLTKVLVTWSDNSSDETGFVVERAIGAGAFGSIATPAAGITSFEDVGLDPSTTYMYRVKAVSGVDVTPPSNEAQVTTPPPPSFPPADPSNLQAQIISPREVDLSWQDNSDDEDFFLLSRATGPSLFSTLATPATNVATFVDASVLPERTYHYKVRAVNPINPSLDSNTVTLTMPPTLEATLLTGKLTDSPDLPRDTLLLSGTVTLGAEAVATAFDSTLHSFSLRLGTFEAAPLVNIPAGDVGWRLRKGVYSWKSPKGSITKAKVTIRSATGEWKVKLSKITLPPAVAGTIRFTVGIGTDAGHVDTEWVPGRRQGQLKFP